MTIWGIFQLTNTMEGVGSLPRKQNTSRDGSLQKHRLEAETDAGVLSNGHKERENQSRACLMDGGTLSATRESAPQGGNLSLLLANLYLDQLDKELEQRGHKFVRYADDFRIYVRSKRAGERVLKFVTYFSENKLGLIVNPSKNCVGSPTKHKFLGFR